MNDTAKLLWGQFSASIDMLGNAIAACPADLWCKPNLPQDDFGQFWRIAAHTVYWLDLYLELKTPETFVMPFGLNKKPSSPYSKEVLLQWIKQARSKCHDTLQTLEANATLPYRFAWNPDNPIPVLELHFYNMRHVQHHAAQLNLLLRQAGHEPPDWVRSGA